MRTNSKSNLKSTFFVLLVSIVAFQSCRKEKQPFLSETELLFQGDKNASPKGFYLLNEGNMNANKASLDYVDFTTGEFQRNSYEEANPERTKGLGDAGSDIGIYGSKLYIVVNNSNKIEVLDAKTKKFIGKIDLINVRYITFHQGKAYASAYLAKIGDPKALNGLVVEIDTASLRIIRKVEVGRQPEELAVVGEKLYVANSGGYSPPNYETTLSVIDLISFTEERRIEVAPNLHRVKADQEGDLYVTSRGNYYDTPSRLYVIDTKLNRVKKTIDIEASNLTIQDEMAYIYSTAWNYETGETTINYHLLNVSTEQLMSASFISDATIREITIPYGIAVNPTTKDVYVSDAKDYVSPGKLYCFSPSGKLKWSVSTGDIPAHFAFLY